MKNSKIIQILSSLHEIELQHFHRFVNSRVFNKHKNVIHLYDIILNHLKNETFELNKTMAFEEIFPNQLYNDKKIRDVMSYLQRVLERFLAFKELYQQDSNELIALSKSFRKRNFWKFFDAAAKRSNNALQTSAVKDMDYHYRNYQLEQEKYFAIVGKKRATETNLQTVTDLLDISYFANRLRQSCYMIAHKNVYKGDYNFGIINEITKEINKKQLYLIPAIAIYYYGYLALTESENIQHFKKLQRELITNVHLFSKEEMRDIYVLATNIGIRFINKDKHEQMSETLELYKTGLSKGILLTNDRISRFTYKNAIAIGLRLQQFEWAEQFIETYKEKLDPIYQEETYHYNLAKLNYSTKKYDTALQLLMTTALSDDVYVNLDTKILLAKVYYELNDLDAFDALITSFQTFIRRKQGISYQRINYQNFINCLRKLATLNQYDKQAKRSLNEEIKTIHPLPEKYWFLTQLDA